MVDIKRLQEHLSECMRKYKDNKKLGYSKCNHILAQFPQKTVTEEPKQTGKLGVKGPGYGNTEEKFKRQPRKEY